MTDQYIGMRKITSIDGDVVTFEDGLTLTYSAKSLEYLITPEPFDEEKLRLLRINKIAQAMMDAMEEHNFLFSDVSSILSQVDHSIRLYQSRTDIKVAGFFDKFNGVQEIQLRNISFKDVQNFLNS